MSSKDGSRLLQLPRELRDQIYTIVFESIRVSYGERFDLRSQRAHIADYGKHRIVPASNSFALLSVCHQMHAETSNMWMKHVLFNFHEPKTMLNKLKSLQRRITQIRHLRLYGLPLLRHLHGFNDVMYTHESVFDLLTGLRLATLTIISNEEDALEYEAITQLIDHGTGWNELFYIVPSSQVLGFMVNGSYTLHDPHGFGLLHPLGYGRVRMKNLLSEEGSRSSGFARLYRADDEQPIASVLDPQRREIFDGLATEDDLRRFDWSKVESSACSKRPLLVHAKRGCGTDITQAPVEPYKVADMYKRFRNRTWKTRRSNLSTYWGEPEDETWHLPMQTHEMASIPQVFDRYDNVNDISLVESRDRERVWEERDYYI